MSGPRTNGSFAGALVELLRPPNVFTAMADAVAGLVLVRGGLPGADAGWWCVPASACLYLGGMALNDFFDREIDARERPERPIPSGRVPPGAAAAIGAGLLVAGIAFAACAGAPVFGIGVALAVAIVLYDGLLKDTPLGPVNMGLCRGLNFFMPMTLGATLGAGLVLPPLLLTAYVTVLTFLSRGEVAGQELARARYALRGFVTVFVGAAGAVVVLGGSLAGWIFFAALLARAAALFGPLRRDASGAATGRAIGGGILLIPLFDATFVAAAGLVVPAIAVAAFMLPAISLKRFYSPT